VSGRKTPRQARQLLGIRGWPIRYNPRVTSPIRDRFDAFFRQGRDIIRRDWDPYLARYYRKLFDEPREVAGLLRWLTRLTRHCSVAETRLLDAGCGFGITSAAFLAIDHPPREVVGLDPSEGKVAMLRRIAEYMHAEDRLKAVLGDAQELALDDASFGSVFVKDVASHVADRDRFFSEVARVLVPGGRLLFTDENNSLSIAGRRARQRIWNEAELGPIPADGYLKRPYLEERFAMITEVRPELSEADRHLLAASSKGMWGEELRDAVRLWTPGSTLINTADFPYRSPLSGEYLEYLFNPFELADDLSRFGLDAKVIPPSYRTGEPWKQRVGDLIGATHPLSIIVQSSFYIVATKRR